MFVWGEALESLEATAVIVGVDEVVQVSLKLSMTVIVKALDGGLFDGPVHSLDLSVCPGMLDLGRSVVDAVLAASAAKYMLTGDVVLFAICKLDAVVGENGMNGVWNCLDEVAQEG